MHYYGPSIQHSVFVFVLTINTLVSRISCLKLGIRKYYLKKGMNCEQRNVYEMLENNESCTDEQRGSSEISAHKCNPRRLDQLPSWD